MSKNLKGINIKIGADTKPLDKALKSVNDSARKTSTELREIDKGLKFNPRSVELLAQKQKGLTDAIQNSADKVKSLKGVYSQVEQQFNNGEIGVEQWNAFKRELVNAESALKNAENTMGDFQQANAKFEQSQKSLNNLLRVTGNEIDAYADVLGTDLVRAIKQGSASADQLEKAFQQIGNHAYSSVGDIDKLTRAVNSIDDGNSIKNINQELNKTEKEATDAGKAVSNKLEKAIDSAKQSAKELANSVKESATNVSGVLGVATGVAGGLSLESAIEYEDIEQKVNVMFNVDDKSKGIITETVREVQKYGTESETVLESARRLWILNGEASNETNKSILKNAVAISSTYDGIDLIELTQETHEIGKVLGKTTEEALGFVSALLDAGFPPEQLDIISEYGTQMQQAGFSAGEIQQIFKNGIETGTWNIDNLLDGVKEGRLRVNALALEMKEGQQDVVKSAGIKLSDYEKLIEKASKGGADGTKAMQELATMIGNVGDNAIQMELGIMTFGTKFEDQGQNMLDVYKNIAGATDETANNVEGMNKKVAEIDAIPSVRLGEAITDLKEAMSPLYTLMVDVIEPTANFVKENKDMLSTMIQVVAIVGVLAGAFALISSPVALITGAIVALIGMFSKLYEESEGFKEIVTTIFGGLGESITPVFDTLKTTLGGLWESIVGFFDENSGTILETFNNIKEGIGSVFENIVLFWDENKETIVGAFTTILTTVQEVFGTIAEFIGEKLADVKAFWDEHGESVVSAITVAIDLIKGVFDLVFPILKTIIKETWDSIKGVIDGAIGVIQGIIVVISGIFNGDMKGILDGLGMIFENGFGLILSVIELTLFGKVFKRIKGFIGDFKGVFTGLKDTVGDWFGGIFNSMKSKGDELLDLVLKPFTNLKDKIAETFGNLKDLIKLPKVTIDSKTIMGIEVPVPNIKWNAEGGIFSKPTIFNTRAGLQGVGEAGAEAIIPLSDSVLSRIGQQIFEASQGTLQALISKGSSVVGDYSGLNTLLTKLTNAVERLNDLEIQPSDVVMDGEKVGQVTYEYVTKNQDEKTKREANAKGVYL